MSELSIGVMGVLWTLVNFLFWSRIRRIEKDIEENKKKCDMIEHNYLDRFERLTEKLSEVEKNILKAIMNYELRIVNERQEKKNQE